MSDERRRVLDLLAQGKITVDEADQLLRALGSAAATADAGTGTGTGTGTSTDKKPRFIRIVVHKPATGRETAEDVNIRIPIPMIKGGMRLGSLIPGYWGERIAARMRERGMDFDFTNLDPNAIEAVFKELNEMGIDIESHKGQVRITAE